MEILSKVVELTKRPTPKNLANGTYSVDQRELDQIASNDTVIINVLGPGNVLIAKPVHSGAQFRSGLRRWTKPNKKGYFRSFTS